MFFLVLSCYWYRTFIQTYSGTSPFDPHREMDKNFSPSCSSSQTTYVEAEEFSRFRFHRKRTASAFLSKTRLGHVVTQCINMSRVFYSSCIKTCHQVCHQIKLGCHQVSWHARVMIHPPSLRPWVVHCIARSLAGNDLPSCVRCRKPSGNAGVGVNFFRSHVALILSEHGKQQDACV